MESDGDRSLSCVAIFTVTSSSSLIYSLSGTLQVAAGDREIEIG